MLFAVEGIKNALLKHFFESANNPGRAKFPKLNQRTVSYVITAAFRERGFTIIIKKYVRMYSMKISLA